MVEVGSRCQGGEGTWLPVAQECIGYTQVSVTISAYLDGKLWDSINKNSFVLKKHGRDVDIVNRKGGVVRSLPGDKLIRELPSFRYLAWDIKPGDYAPITIDCFTRPGCVQLVNESEQQADADLETIHSFEDMRMIDYAVICPVPPITGAVVVVDPYTTGANLAAMVVNWGYRLILVFSDMESPVAKLVAKGTSLSPTLMIQHNNASLDQDDAVATTLTAIKSCGAPVLAILAGAETGVELTDKLSSRFGTRNNGEEKTEARRNKFRMQEVVRTYGLRAIRQKLCYSELEVSEFITSLAQIQISKCVLKPNESAGSDNVILCSSEQEAKIAFNTIHGHLNGLGKMNNGALCQEYLEGTEFVIDGVSRDGVYKVTAIWQYDKRSVHGANFVYYGMWLRSADGERERSIVQYAQQIVNALGIMQGPSHMEVFLKIYVRIIL